MPWYFICEYLIAAIATRPYHNAFYVVTFRERAEPPRFARPGTFEHEYSKRWKSLDEMEKQQRQQVEKNMQEAREKLEGEMEEAYHEHQANLLRQGV